MQPLQQPIQPAIHASDASYQRLIQDALDSFRQGAGTSDGAPMAPARAPRLENIANVVLDFPRGYAFLPLGAFDSIERARTLVVTQASHPIYMDCIASYHVSSVVNTLDDPSLLAGLYAAATGQRTYQWKSGLTYMEMRVVRALLRGLDTVSIALELSIANKTVNAHMSNVLLKTGVENRAQLMALLLTAKEATKLEA
jgi:DNA-binding NarL/FixJ family response regulator